MKIFASLICTAVIASAKCVCPPKGTSEGRRLLQEPPQCCIDQQFGGAAAAELHDETGNVLKWAGDAKMKHTPGNSCSSAGSCGDCTILDFCVWGHGQNYNSKGDHAKASFLEIGSKGVDLKTELSTGVGCIDINHIEVHMLGAYSHTCDKAPFGPAEITDEEYLDNGIAAPTPEPFYEKAPETYKTPPKIVLGQGKWPGQFSGYLPPASCRHSTEIDPRPQCSDADPSLAFIYPQWLPNNKCPCEHQPDCGCAGLDFHKPDEDHFPTNSLVR
jgi:hypothetical protein